MHGKEDVTQIQVSQADISSNFSLRYLSAYARAGVISEHVRLLLAPCKPLQLVYTVEGLLNLRTFLAPRLSPTEVALEDRPAKRRR